MNNKKQVTLLKFNSKFAAEKLPQGPQKGPFLFIFGVGQRAVFPPGVKNHLAEPFGRKGDFSEKSARWFLPFGRTFLFRTSGCWEIKAVISFNLLKRLLETYFWEKELNAKLV